MDSSLSLLMKRDGDDRDIKESEICGPLHKSGDCNYINCSYTIDHYHCQMCGSGAVEASQAVYHIRSSPSCRRDIQHSQYPNESTSTLHANAYNAFYGGLTAQNPLCSSSYTGYSQLDTFQWHPTLPVDKMTICGPQLSPCFSASNNGRIPMDPLICSPISDLYSKSTGPVKDLVSLPTKSSGTPSDTQPWFYNNQPMPVYKYVEQSSVPQINFVLIEPPAEHKEGALSTDLLPYSYSSKIDCNASHRDKESFPPFYPQQNLQSVSSDDSGSLFTLQIPDENLSSKQADLFSNQQINASSVCVHECSSKNKDGNCCMLIAEPSSTQNTDMSSFTEFEPGNISDGEHSSSGSESDIIVEDTADQLSSVAESQISIETIKCSLLEEVENVTQKNNGNFTSLAMAIKKCSVPVGGNVGCALCNDHSPGSVLVHLGSQVPVTSTSHSPLLPKLSELLHMNASDVVNTLGGLLCQRCLGLVDAVDSLESQVKIARQNILQMFKIARKSGATILADSDMHLNQINTPQEEEVNIFSKKDSAEKPGSLQLEKVSQNDSLTKEQNISKGTEIQTKIQDKTESYAFFCNFCGSAFVTSSELNSHFAVHKQCDTKFLCEVCGRRFQYRHQHQIDFHLSHHFPANRFPCKECDKTFKCKRALGEHSKVHSGDRPFSCPNCGRRFAHSSNMRSHFKLCSGDLPYRCDTCKAGFTVLARLHRHVALVHTGLAGFKCTHSQCNRTFGKSSDFRAHLRVHSTLRTFSCPVCDRSYKSLSNLNQHAKSHRKEKPFNCHVCGQGFLRKDSWESHMLSHKNERSFECSQCPKAFWSKDNLAMHEKRHAGTHKKNKCPVCGKTFSQKLSVHMRTHTGARPYRCLKCDKAFSTGSSLNKHVLRKH